MLNLSCVICAELFAPNDDVHVTNCGHLFHFLCINQWLERSKTCPQCRNKCTGRTIVRVYFNFANLDASRIDLGALQEQLDNLNLQLKIKEKDLNKANDEIKTLKEVQKKCKKTIAGLEEEVKKKEFIIYSYTEQVKLLKIDSKMVENLRCEVRSLKNQLETMEGMSCVMTATKEETEKLVKTESDPKKLAVWVTTLKRELRSCESKKTDLRNMLKVVQKQLQTEVETKKTLMERISHLESDNYELNQKLCNAITSQSSPKLASISPSKNLRPSVIGTLKCDVKRISISPATKENVKKIEESNSPYFNIKASSIGLGPFLKRNQEALSGKTTGVTTTKLAILKISPVKNGNNNPISNASSSASSSSNALMNGAIRKISSDLSDKYSIFKKPRLGIPSGSDKMGSNAFNLKKSTSSKYVSNGFGGLERIDPFAKRHDNEKNPEKTPRNSK